MSKQTPEGKLKKEYRAWLRAQGAYVFSPVQMGFGTASVDDFVCYKGHFFAIEAKRPDDPKARPTARQEQCLRAVEAAGGMTCVARSLEDVKRMLFV